MLSLTFKENVAFPLVQAANYNATMRLSTDRNNRYFHIILLRIAAYSRCHQTVMGVHDTKTTLYKRHDCSIISLLSLSSTGSTYCNVWL